MSITDELCDSIAAEEFLLNLHKEERMTPNICLEFEQRRNPEILRPSWKVADEFRQCLIAKNLQCSTIVAFLDTLLIHIKKKAVASHEFTRSICTYLFATKYLASNITLGSNVITVIDVLIDIDEEIRSIRSIRPSIIMQIVHRKYLSKSPVGGPVELDDANFIKHLILFHLWYKAETISERPNVLKIFLSTIKPSHRLRLNPIYAPFLHSYNDDEVDDYKKLIQQPFDQKSLVMALRQVEMNQIEVTKTIFLDLTGDETTVKSEVTTPNLPGEVINVDDDDDELEISYLPTLYKQLNDRCEGINKISLRSNVPVEIIEIVNDSDVESTAELTKCNNSISEMDGIGQCDITVVECDSDRNVHLSALTLDTIHSCSSFNVKTYSRKSTVLTSKKRSKIRRNSFSLSQTYLKPSIKLFPSVIRSRSYTTLSKAKKVTFRDPLITSPDTYVFERCDYNESMTSNSVRQTPQTSSITVESPNHSDSSSGYIVTGPKCNYPYVTATALRPSISLSQVDDDISQHLSSERKRGKLTKRRAFNRKRNPRTTIDNWMKRKRINTNMGTASTNSGRTQLTETKISSTGNPQRLAMSQHSRLKDCSVRLKRCYTELQQKVKRVSVDLVPFKTGLNDVFLTYTPCEDMSCNDIEVHARKKNRMQANSEQEKVSTQLCDVINDLNPVKIKTPQKRLNASKSAKKSTKRKSVSKTAKKCSSKVQNRQTIAAVNTYTESRIRDCFISLKKLTNHVVLPPSSHSSQRTQRLSYNLTINSINFNDDAIGRLPTKSPQEYQFKRSFEKMPTLEVTLLPPVNETLVPVTITADVEQTSNPIEPLVSNSQSMLPIFNDTPTTTQFMDQFTYQSPSIEASPQSTEVPDQTSDARTNHASKLTNYQTNIQQLNRNSTNYIPDTPSSSVPQYSLISSTEDSCNEMLTGMISPTDTPTNIGKQLGMHYNDCDTDIPSPAYSPYVGKRKSCAKQKVSIPQIHQYITTSISDLIAPIDLSKGNDTIISVISTVNDTVTGDMSCRNDDVDSTQRNYDGDVFCDNEQRIDELSLSERQDELGAIVEFTKDRVTSKVNSTDYLPESTSFPANTNDNLKKPKIYVKSTEELCHIEVT